MTTTFLTDAHHDIHSNAIYFIPFTEYNFLRFLSSICMLDEYSDTSMRTNQAERKERLRVGTNFLRRSKSGFPGIIRLSFAVKTFRRANSVFFSLPPVLFSRACLANPRAIGAVCPSSSRLAHALANRVELPGDGDFVLELGAGTGVVTAALLDRGIDPARLLVVEQDRLMVRHLKNRFPQVTVIHGDAVRFCQWCYQQNRHICTVVSSLPLLSLPSDTVEALGETLLKILDRKGSLLQYTYRLNKKPGPLSPYMERISSQTVWGNLPPARVEVFKARHFCSTNSTCLN